MQALMWLCTRPQKMQACRFPPFPVFCPGFPAIYSIRLFSRNNKFAYVELTLSLTYTLSSHYTLPYAFTGTTLSPLTLLRETITTH